MTSPQVGVHIEPIDFRVVDCPNCGMDAVAFDLMSITLLDGVPQGVDGPSADECSYGECDACDWSGQFDDDEVSP